MSRTHKIKLLLVAVTLGGSCLLPMSAFALDQQSFGGNNAADYQPPTGNPQNNTSTTSLQPNNNILQPVTALNQQALIQNGGLSVLTAPDKGAASTAAEPVAVKKSHGPLIAWIVGGLLALMAAAYILFKPDKNTETVPVEPGQPEKQTKTENPKNIKKPAKKISRKKRKAARR